MILDVEPTRRYFFITHLRIIALGYKLIFLVLLRPLDGALMYLMLDYRLDVLLIGLHSVSLEVTYLVSALHWSGFGRRGLLFGFYWGGLLVGVTSVGVGSLGSGSFLSGVLKDAFSSLLLGLFR